MSKESNFIKSVALVTGVAAVIGLISVHVVAAADVDKRSNQMKIKIGTNTFIATLEESATTEAFKAMLPMTVLMSDLNANEKLFRLSTSLPTSEANPGTIRNGDLMLYGPRTLVLFYKTFSTPYEYTRLGRITHSKGLASAVGAENVTVTFEMD